MISEKYSKTSDYMKNEGMLFIRTLPTHPPPKNKQQKHVCGVYNNLMKPKSRTVSMLTKKEGGRWSKFRVFEIRTN